MHNYWIYKCLSVYSTLAAFCTFELGVSAFLQTKNGILRDENKMTEVIKILNNIITNVLTALYRPCGFSLLLSFFSMFFYLYAYRPINVGKGWKAAISEWKKEAYNRMYWECDYDDAI